jgi:hypothetical protein
MSDDTVNETKWHLRDLHHRLAHWLHWNRGYVVSVRAGGEVWIACAWCGRVWIAYRCAE